MSPDKAYIKRKNKTKTKNQTYLVTLLNFKNTSNNRNNRQFRKDRFQKIGFQREGGMSLLYFSSSWGMGVTLTSGQGRTAVSCDATVCHSFTMQCFLNNYLHVWHVVNICSRCDVILRELLYIFLMKTFLDPRIFTNVKYSMF